MKKFLLPVLILMMSLLYIFVIPSELVIVKLLFKVIPMLLIITYAYMQAPDRKQYYDWMLLTGLFFCMLGDAFIIYEFIFGLAAFLIGHLFYMTGFFRKWRFSKLHFAAIIPIGLYAYFMGGEIIQALIRDNNKALIVPVLLYITVISLMMWSAIMTGHKWAIIGSITFGISDSILSWNMFVTPFASAGTLVMITYYAAQFCIAYSLRAKASQASSHSPAITGTRS
ncbi:lysoplasmalogenase [Paenibacillus terrigena]|uniref:lysoplasmalogenase n=1 Tax=Paenibacillus terrigena TaxID=369333 RepID=UPI0028CFE49C|nr:lysoplasmalogenase [Paenibacillus terrigena]